MTSDWHEPASRMKASDLSCPERRSFVKGIVSLGAGLAASSFRSHAAQAQSSASAKPALPSDAPAAGASQGADVGPIVPSSGLGSYFHVFYQASQKPDELQIAVNYTLWLPEDIQTVRGVIVHQHGAGL
jgi:hypothetical protein